jgi:D-amino-acid oxidase
MDGISTSPTPLQAPTKDSACVLVLGGGVIGLTTAWTLLDRGIKVTILSDEWASFTEMPRLSSQAAGALWKCLPLECGPQAITANLATNQKWTLESYKVYSALATNPELENVVELRPCTIVTTGVIEGNPVMANKLNFVEKNLPGYRRGSELFGEYSINSEHAGGLAEAYEYTAPVINVDRAMRFLTDLVKSKGAVLKTGTIKGDLLDQESKLLEEYKVDAIVNAMGLGASEVAADPNVYGLHGALLRLVNDGKDFPIVRNAIIVSSTKVGESGGDGAFILPCSDGILALGTISEAKGEATDLTLDSDAVKEMRARCEDLLPQLKNARLDPNYPLIRGTRPQRRGGPRVERETRRAESRIIHSYGHGGAGWSLAMGSARDAAGLVDEVIAQALHTIESRLMETVWDEEKMQSSIKASPLKSQVLV